VSLASIAETREWSSARPGGRAAQQLFAAKLVKAGPMRALISAREVELIHT
jgi:hypothetical protein